MTTVFVEGSSGSIIKMDVPTDPHGAERFAADIANGRLTVIEESRIIETRHPRWPDSVIYVVDRSIAATADVEANAASSDEPTDDLASKSKQDLFDFAASAGIETKASWNKQQLLDAIAAASDSAVATDDDASGEGNDDVDDQDDGED